VWLDEAESQILNQALNLRHRTTPTHVTGRSGICRPELKYPACSDDLVIWVPQVVDRREGAGTQHNPLSQCQIGRTWVIHCAVLTLTEP